MIRTLWRWFMGNRPRTDYRNHMDPVIRICWSLENRAWEWSHNDKHVFHPSGVRISIQYGFIYLTSNSGALFGETATEMDMLAVAVRCYLAWKLDPVYPLDVVPPICSPTPIKGSAFDSITVGGAMPPSRYRTGESVSSSSSGMGSPGIMASGSKAELLSSSRAET